MSVPQPIRKDPGISGVWKNVTVPDLPLDFELTDRTGSPYRLSEHLAEGPVVVMFNRGDW